MQLDRTLNPDGKGKYALINMRKIPGSPKTAQELAAAILANPECVEFGAVGDRDEFWLIKLKDAYAEPALLAYAGAAQAHDFEYAQSVLEMSTRSGVNSPFYKFPD